MEQTFEIVIDQLVTDEEFRHLFLRNPRRTLSRADEWGLPLCASEIHALIQATPAVWESVVEEVDARLQEAA